MILKCKYKYKWSQGTVECWIPKRSAVLREETLRSNRGRSRQLSDLYPIIISSKTFWSIFGGVLEAVMLIMVIRAGESLTLAQVMRQAPLKEPSIYGYHHHHHRDHQHHHHHHHHQHQHWHAYRLYYDLIEVGGRLLQREEHCGGDNQQLLFGRWVPAGQILQLTWPW